MYKDESFVKIKLVILTKLSSLSIHFKSFKTQNENLGTGV